LVSFEEIHQDKPTGDDKMKVTIKDLMAQYEKMHTAYVFDTQKDFKREALKLGDDLRELRAELREKQNQKVLTEELEKPIEQRVFVFVHGKLFVSVKDLLAKETTKQ